MIKITLLLFSIIIMTLPASSFAAQTGDPNGINVTKVQYAFPLIIDPTDHSDFPGYYKSQVFTCPINTIPLFIDMPVVLPYDSINMGPYISFHEGLDQYNNLQFSVYVDIDGFTSYSPVNFPVIIYCADASVTDGNQHETLGSPDGIKVIRIMHDVRYDQTAHDFNPVKKCPINTMPLFTTTPIIDSSSYHTIHYKESLDSYNHLQFDIPPQHLDFYNTPDSTPLITYCVSANIGDYGDPVTIGNPNGIAIKRVQNTSVVENIDSSTSVLKSTCPVNTIPLLTTFFIDYSYSPVITMFSGDDLFDLNNIQYSTYIVYNTYPDETLSLTTYCTAANIQY